MQTETDITMQVLNDLTTPQRTQTRAHGYGHGLGHGHGHGYARARPRPRILKMLSVLAVMGLLLAMLAACGDEDDPATPGNRGSNGGSTSTPTIGAGSGTSTPTDGDTGTPTSDDIAHPVGAGDLIIKIEDVGGFVPQEYLLTRMPSFALYGDGCFIVQGAQIEIYPQPLLPPLFEVCLTEAGIQQVLQKAQAAGLLDGDAEYDFPGIADATTTVITTNAGDVQSVVRAYALGIDPEANPELTPEENAAREALATFMGEMQSLTMWMPAEMIAESEHEYDATENGMRLLWLDADTAALQDEGLTRQEVDWPLTIDLATFGEPYWNDDYRCGVVTGEDLEMLMPLLQSANQLTLWHSGDLDYTLYARPMLPDETGCTEPAMQ